MRNEELYLKEIIEQINIIEKSAFNKSKEELEKNLDLRDATIRRIEVIGEAVKYISKETKEKYPQVEWKKIAGARDNIIHRYFSIDLNIIWNIIKINIPVLKKQISEILEYISKEEK